MSRTVRNALIIGVMLGFAVVWVNWPPGAMATEAPIARAIGQVIGTTLMVLLFAALIGRMSKR